MEMKIAIILSRVELPFRELLRKHQTYMREVFESRVQGATGREKKIE